MQLLGFSNALYAITTFFIVCDVGAITRFLHCMRWMWVQLLGFYIVCDEMWVQLLGFYIVC